jgi:hypothetical protein
MRVPILCLTVCLFSSAAFSQTHPEGQNPASPATDVLAGSSTKTSPAASAPGAVASESELEQLRSVVQAQAKQLQELRARLATLEGRVAGGQPSATEADTAAGAAPPSGATPFATLPVAATVASSASHSASDSVSSDSSAASTGNGQPNAASAIPVVGNALPPQADQAETASPLSFKIGVAKFTPGGFLDATAFFRTTNLGSGIATSFGTVPFNSVLPQAALSETRFSAQYSRLSLKVEAPITSSTSITGYVESDFLGFQPANALVTANSDSLRLRIYMGDVKHGNWEFVGGQDWTLLQPNRTGVSPYTPDVFYTLNEDPNFQVGLIWARQEQFRVIYHPTSYWSLAVSLEDPQQFVPASVTFPSAYFTGQFDNGSGSTSAASAATNTAVPNLHPDVIVKTAFDWKPGGRAFHLELAGLVRSFKVSNDLTTPTSTNTITGGGGSLNMNFEVFKNFRLIGDSFWSDGGGRYIFGLGPDVIVKPNGTLSAVHSGAGIGGFEWQTTKTWMFDAYYGGAYFQRDFGLLPATSSSSCDGISGFSCVGFGYPGSPNTSNRALQEATVDVIPTLWSNPNYGKVQIIMQYSYLVRSPWWISTLATGANPKNAHLSMVYLDFRYTLP